MYNLINVISFFCFCLIQLTEAQEIFTYNDEFELTKDHFQANPEDLDTSVFKRYGSNVCAYIGTDILFVGDFKLRSAEAEVKAVLYEEKSWLRSDFQEDESVLKHELYHFKITEIFARKFRCYLLTQSQGINDINQTFDDFRVDCLKYQELYDLDTNHRNNIEAQKMWEDRIDGELNELERYAWEKTGKIRITY